MLSISLSLQSSMASYIQPFQINAFSSNSRFCHPCPSKPPTIVAMAPQKKARLLSKAEELGFTLSSIEKLGVFSKVEELGLLSLLEKLASVSPAAMASAALPVLVAAVAAIVLILDDSAGLVAVQYVLAGSLMVGGVGLFIGSVVLDGLQEAE